MDKHYDIVVVGAGNAGLSAALHCACEGKKVLLIEQHNLPGGCATSFRRGRFEFEPSLHELCDIGSEDDPAEIRQMMMDYGVEVDWSEVPDCFRIISKYSDGTPMDVSMPFGCEAFIDKMEYYVPGSREKMEEYFGIPEGSAVRLVLAVGYPKTETPAREKIRKPFDEVVSFNKW